MEEDKKFTNKKRKGDKGKKTKESEEEKNKQKNKEGWEKIINLIKK